MPSRPRSPAGCRTSTLLSHDLFEGIFARAGLASDIEVVEEFPARYDVAALRHHRWARGDWQLLPWIFGRGPVAGADRTRSAIPAIGRWKMLDNLRRTLSAPACMLALLAGWRCRSLPRSVWTGFVLLTILLPPLIPVARRHRAAPRAGSRCAAICGALGADLRMRAGPDRRSIVTFLAHQAWLMGDAIARTLCAAVRHPPASARMGPGGAGDDRPAARPARLLSRDGRRRSRSAFWRCWSPCCARPWRVAAGGAVRRAVDRLAGDRALDQPVAADRRPRCRCRPPTPRRCG